MEQVAEVGLEAPSFASKRYTLYKFNKACIVFLGVARHEGSYASNLDP